MPPDDVTTFRRAPIFSLEPLKPAAHFEDWIGQRSLPALSTNAGGAPLPFQRWHRFKEAFSPELVEKAVAGSDREVKRLCDPFGGSGTSALSAQFLGIESVSIEVNPFLADLIEAKTCHYDVRDLLGALPRVSRQARHIRPRRLRGRSLPETFIQPGRGDRWLFDATVYAQINKLISAIEAEEDQAIRRLFRVLLGGILVTFSNAVVSGKGRRYRRAWQTRPANPDQLLPHFCEAVRNAITEIDASGRRPRVEASVLRGDSRKLIADVGPVDLIVTSPPYPNSFDYTDVYNIELWVLGYLTSSQTNQQLRKSTLSSHVQVRRDFAAAPPSPTLNRVLKRLRGVRSELWDEHLVEMVGGYFADLQTVLNGCSSALRRRGQVWLVVGDSQYNGIKIKVADILAELAPMVGLRPLRSEPFRSMRASPQQGGNHQLGENLLVLSKH